MAAVPGLNETKPPHCNTYKSEFARRIAANKINEEFQYFAEIYDKLQREDFKGFVKGDDAVLHALKLASQRANQPLLDETQQIKELPQGSKVCIIGAGMSGLYIAMILDALAIPGLSYDILEGSDRVGGRVYTHHFSTETLKTDDAVQGKRHDYYDVGAMRFPRIDIMEKTFKLFEHLSIPLIDYYMKSPEGDPTGKEYNEPSRYNDITVIGDGTPKVDDKGNELQKDDFKVSETWGGRIMPELVRDPHKYVAEAFFPFKERLRANWSKGFNALMKYDNFSVRGFMMAHGITPLDDYYSIQWLETLTDGSGLYDQSFTEGVIDSLDFDFYTEYVHPEKKVNWFCIDGGAQLVPYAMNKMLEKPIVAKDLNKRVTKIAHDQDDKGMSPMRVGVDGESQAREYMTVFATPTLACLQRVDLTGLELLYEQKDAIRSLHYDTASKVGMQFKNAWWIKFGIKGGLGKTDMPLRTCVYPSYNLHDSGPAVLLCSYSWSQDAARIGSLMKDDPEKEGELKRMLINNLTWLHLEHARAFYKNPQLTFDELHKEVNDSYITHHAFDWHNNPFTSGAYGKFGPGQFSNLYSALTCPTADSRFHFVGEAVSAHHGWIVGALDSAHQAVLNFLRRFNLKDAEEKLATLDWVGPPPDEISRESAIKKVLLGRIDPDKRLEARSKIEAGKTDTRIEVVLEKTL